MKFTRADRRKTIHTYQHWVYGLYKKNRLVYVGVTADPAWRARNHSKTKDFDEFRLIKGFSSRFKADEFEKFAIQELLPPLNILIEGTSYSPSKIARKDYERILGTVEPTEFDFSLLRNQGVKRREAWVARRR